MTPEEHILFSTRNTGDTWSAGASSMPNDTAAHAQHSASTGGSASTGELPDFLESTTPAHAAPTGFAHAAQHRAEKSSMATIPAKAVPEVPAEAVPEVSVEAVPEAPTRNAAASGASATPGASAAPPSSAAAPSQSTAGTAAAIDSHAASSASADQGDADENPETTAEIDTAEVEARLDDLGSTQSFTPPDEERINTDSTYDAGTTPSLMWGARSDVGCVREHNEDSYLVQSPLFCVCDGMGGHAAGEVASSIAVETIARLAPHEADPTLLAQAVESANAAIIEAAANGLGKPGMGCTATAAYIEGNEIAIAHVGDSRAYLLHEGSLIRITHDHSYVEELVDAGEITADEARVHPNRSVITRALGSDPAMYADHFKLNIEEGDRLILCSDGLSSMIPDGEIETVATQSPTAQICVDNLVDAALNAGGSDNVTVVAVDVVDDGRMRDLARRRKRNIFIAVGGLIAAIIIALVVAAFVITNSVFLGVNDGCVAIYSGVPNTFMGIELYSLSDETTIDIDDLPEDTQNRLNAGISMQSMDEARETISEYRQQIYEDQTRAAENAAAINGDTDTSSSDTDADDAAASSATDEGDTDDTAASSTTDDAAATDDSTASTKGDS